MSVVYDTNKSNYEKGFAIGYENIRVMYAEKGVMPTIRFIENVDYDARNNPDDSYKRGYIDGCVKCFKNINNNGGIAG